MIAIMADRNEAMNLSRSISIESASILMTLLLERGELVKSSTFETVQKCNPASDHYTQSADGSDGAIDSLETLISTEFGTYLTLNHLESMVLDELASVGGRMAVTELKSLLGIAKTGPIESCLVRLGVFQVNDQVLTESYTARLMNEIVCVLNQSSTGTLAVTDLASQFDLPPDAVQQMLLQPGLLPPTVHLLTQENGSRSVVSDMSLRHLQASLHGVLLGVSAPTQIRQLCRDRQWEPVWVTQLIMPQLADTLPGDVHGDVYVPHTYTKQQRQAVEDFFRANGFISTDHGQKLGVLPSTLRQYISQTFPSALGLSECLVNRDRLIPFLEALVQEASDSASWVDLSLHLPPELLGYESDCRTLLLDHVLSNEGADGVVVITCDAALFMSQSMVQCVLNETILPLIEPWSKRRALEMLKSEGDESKMSSAVTLDAIKKSKRVSRKTQAQPTSIEGSDVNQSVLPLEDIVTAVAMAHRDLAELPDETPAKDSALVQLCEKAFHSSDVLISMCKRGIEAEVLRLENERAVRVTSSRKGSAAKGKNLQVSFEDTSCFPTFCYFIQGFSSFMVYASEAQDSVGKVITEQETKSLERDFLLCCGAEFSRRVSLFCLFKNEVDDQCFSFEPMEVLSAELSHYCSPVQLITRNFPLIYFTCRGEDDQKQQGPLTKLRSALPATVGTALARQWLLCGAESYQGGMKPGDYEGFLSHIEEHCYTICGLPFKKFDKKAKKQFLNARRQQLVQALECETDPGACLDFAVMLLFQLVRNHIVFGSLLTGPILRLLCNEKKISDDVSNALQFIADKLTTGETIEMDTIERTKKLVLGFK